MQLHRGMTTADTLATRIERVNAFAATVVLNGNPTRRTPSPTAKTVQAIRFGNVVRAVVKADPIRMQALMLDVIAEGLKASPAFREFQRFLGQ